MAGVKSFEELIVWQRGMQLASAIYKLTKEFPREEMFGLTSQLRRAAVSIPSNIAEGQGRRTTGEFLQFLGVARGSNFEVQTQLAIARDLGFGGQDQAFICKGLSNEVGRMINGLISSLEE